jgi:hypothetical protein
MSFGERARDDSEGKEGGGGVSGAEQPRRISERS